MIAPIIFCTVVTGIAGMQKMREVGRTGGLALIYFEVVTTFALIIGLAGRTGLVDFNFVWLLSMTCVALLLLSRTAGIGRRGGAALVGLYAVFVAVQLVYASG